MMAACCCFHRPMLEKKNYKQTSVKVKNPAVSGESGWTRLSFVSALWLRACAQTRSAAADALAESWRCVQGPQEEGGTGWGGDVKRLINQHLK